MANIKNGQKIWELTGDISVQEAIDEYGSIEKAAQEAVDFYGGTQQDFLDVVEYLDTEIENQNEEDEEL